MRADFAKFAKALSLRFRGDPSRAGTFDVHTRRWVVRTRLEPRSRLFLMSFGLAIFTAAVPAEAQLLYGGLVGAVVDAHGAVVPGASVTIINTDTNLRRETTTDGQGAYSFANVLA